VLAPQALQGLLSLPLPLLVPTAGVGAGALPQLLVVRVRVLTAGAGAGALPLLLVVRVLTAGAGAGARL
jgi:hypothetical protein